jgi:NADH-quinone oxidoreductase subunit L
VEREVGTTDLTQLSGLGRQMPLTFTCFLIAAAAIAGVPPLNGFYSKELVFDAALQSNVVFFIIAAAGAFCTAASFLKLGHTVYFGKPSKLTSQASESPWPMVLPMIVLAGTCVLFGVYNTLPLQYMIEPVLGGLVEQSFSGLLPHNWILAGISVGVLLLAVANHAFGVRRTGKAIGAVDHIHNAPVLKSLYASAEAGSFDPYKLSGSVVDTFAVIMDYLDKGIDWVVSRMSTGLALLAGRGLDRIHTGRHWMYVLWVLAGVVVVTVIFIFGGGGLI